MAVQVETSKESEGASVEAPSVEAHSVEARRGGMFRALSYRNFRLFWTGAFLSNIGTWMQAVAQGWLVYHLTNSTFWLGLDGFMATVPGLLLTLLGGVFADLIDRRRLLIYTQIGAGLSALTLAVLVVTDAVHVWMILALSFVTGCCMALAGPSYQAITVDLVGREDVPNAIALNSTQFQLSRVIGPVFAGLAFNTLGIAGCFFGNAASFIAVVVSLSLVRYDDDAGRPGLARAAKGERAIWHDLVAGVRYVRKRPRVFMLLLISASTSLFGAPYLTLVPYFARDILHMDEKGLSLLMGVSGVGACVAALLLAFLGNFRRKGWSVLGGSFFFALSLVGFSLSTHVATSMLFIFGMGFAIVSCVAVINTLLQQLVTDEMRGRVMSMFILSFVGAMPLGNLIAATASQRFGAPHTLAAGGIIIAVFVTIMTLSTGRIREL